MARKKLTLRLDENVILKAKERGINISGFLEVKLMDYLLGYDILNQECRGRDLNPRTPARQDVSSHEPFLCFDLKSCAVGHAWLPLQTINEITKCGRRDSNPGKRLGGPQS
jgi:hypothetical protein